jgi:hypothetical protein
MSRWGRALGSTAVAGGIGCIASAFVACGSFGSADAFVAAKPDADASVADARRTEQPLTTFACGTTLCLAGHQACCQIQNAFGCFDLDGGGCTTTGVDAGADAAPPPPPILCTSYRNCDYNQECCYRPDLGSSCQNSCPNGSTSICNAGDQCGQYGECKALANAPAALPKAGECTYSGYPTGGGSSHSPWGGGR